MKKPFSKLFGLKNKDDIIGYTEEERNNNVESIHIERIVPNRYQPRQVFEPNKITYLSSKKRKLIKSYLKSGERLKMN
ncbi:Uncharacterised protein [Mycobacteroides abscessus subsp. abscessus]|nr:Uncharacterised protein [Mycobacteroides abscessus subsp. abscessus]